MSSANRAVSGVYELTYIDEILAEVARATPKYGFNVCMMDDDEEVGEKISILGHFDTMAEAQSFSDDIEGTVYIYAGSEEAEEGMSVAKNHIIPDYIKKAEDDYNKGKNSDNDDYEKINYGGESIAMEYAGQPTAQPHRYGVQEMLDSIVNKSLGVEDKAELSEMVKDGFTLDALLELVATKLASKAGKKLGVESSASEGSVIIRGRNGKATCFVCGSIDTELEIFERAVNDSYPWEKYENWTCNNCGNIIKGDVVSSEAVGLDRDWDDEEQTPQQGYQWEDLDKEKPQPWQKGGEVNFTSCYGCMGSGRFMDGSVCPICGGLGQVDNDTKTAGVEGGRGSGRRGHSKWMLEGEANDDCPNCMVQTEKKDGKCTICNN